MIEARALSDAQRRALAAVHANEVAWLPARRKYRGARSDVIERLLHARFVEVVWRGASGEGSLAITDLGREALNV